MMIVDNKFEIGEIVYCITDEQQRRRIICYLKIYNDNHIIYATSQGDVSCDFYDFELTKEENLELKLK